jgi:hypothetical protein
MAEELQGSESHAPKRRFKLWLVLGAAVIVLGLVGFVGMKAGRERAAHPFSVTFLCYTNIGPQGLRTDYRLARFRITNNSRYPFYCLHGVADVECAGNWIQETNGFLYIQNPAIIEPRKSATVSVLAPSKGTRWRDTFVLMPVGKTPPWKLKLGQYIGRLPLGTLGARMINDWMYSDLQRRVVTSETMTL